MPQPLISCIVPVYNGELYLREAIDSILSQAYSPLELIVVDDGSTDGTEAIANSYGDRIRYCRQPNGGPGVARNTGLILAKGEFVAFLDADDLWHPAKLLRQMSRFRARGDLALSITHVQHFWIPELKSQESDPRYRKLVDPMPGYLVQTLVAQRALFDTVGFFNPALKLAEDTDWFLRARERRITIEVLPEVLVYRRMHRSNISRLSHQLIVDAVKLSLDRRREQNRDPVARVLPKD